MAKEDEEKIAFITRQGIFCYSKMPFRLKNAGATYQRLVDKAFQKQIGQNLEVYVDHLVIKSSTEQIVIRDIEETFKILKEINMKLNPKMHLWNERGHVSGIVELPTLTAPKEKEELVIYLAAAKEAINAVLMTKRDGKQMPIYFVSLALQGPEVNYTPMEKLILALMLFNLGVTGRLLKWRFELEEHDIHYRPRTLVKGQILVNFIVERQEDESSDTPMKDKEKLPDPWILFTDGSSCVDKSEAFIAGLRIAEQMGVKNLQANVDSRLVANQVNGNYVAKEPGMIKYLEKHARRPKIRGGESSKIRILLANHARKGQEINKGVQKLSGSSPRDNEPAAKLDPHHIPMAILQMEDRHS
nr:hypothetical protein [Tanacetum cinerariifolium]